MHKTCPICGRLFLVLRRDKQTCGPSCKRALQRGGLRGPDHRGRGRPSPHWSRRSGAGAAKGDILLSYPHGCTVHYRDSKYDLWKPGRINWHSAAADMIRSWTSDLDRTALVPVEGLFPARIMSASDVRRA